LQNAARFIRPVFTRKESGSDRDHMFRCLHRPVGALAAIDRIEHGYNGIDIFVVVRIISHTTTACAHGFVAATCGQTQISLLINVG
jgi:hypothetical protein